MYNRFRTATPMADWRSFRVPFGTDTEIKRVGQLYLVNDTWVMAFSGDYGDGDTIETDIHDEWVAIYNCEKILVDKSTETGSAFLTGEKVYVDPGTGLVHNAIASGYVCIGICTEPAGDDAVRVEIDLKGDSMTDQP